MSKRDIVIYLAGPYSASHRADIRHNVEIAHRFAEKIWRWGYTCLSPISNTAWMDNAEMQWEDWMDGDFVMLERCDAIVMLPGWSNSRGATAERQHAIDMGIPVYEVYPHNLKQALPPSHWDDMAPRGDKQSGCCGGGCCGK
jgi:hypothetical protein